MSSAQSAEIAVIDAFLRDCPDADPASVGEWCHRHPEHADAIMEAAAALIVAPPPELREVPDGATLAARRDAAIARAEAILAREQPTRSLRELIAAARMDLPTLADTIEIEREPLAEVEAGHVALPLPRRLVAALVGALSATMAAVEAALRQAHDQPRLGHASSEGSPTIGKVTWRELIEDSDMTDERKAHWLAED